MGFCRQLQPECCFCSDYPCHVATDILVTLGSAADCFALLCSSAQHRRATQVVQELKRECAGRDSQGRQREASAVAWSLQRYLVFAILSCIPGAGSLPPYLFHSSSRKTPECNVRRQVDHMNAARCVPACH